MKKLIGRNDEIKLLERLYASDESAFVAVYGRRRVGKTFLIKSVLGERFTFYTTGVANTNTRAQLSNFHAAMLTVFENQPDIERPTDWFDAFRLLIKALKRAPEGKKVLFFDELPWLDSPKSQFVQALEYFWNSWASDQPDMLLIVCGSAASWMTKSLINHRGGLHNRVTHRIPVAPFTLAEVEAYFTMRNAPYQRYQLLQLYMVTGGVPFYLAQIDVVESIPQNIDRLCFHKSGLLRKEFDNLYASLFRKPEQHLAYVETLAEKISGLTRDELITRLKLTNGGHVTRVLQELEESGFISRYRTFGSKSKGMVYRLSDHYSLFYLRFLRHESDLADSSWLLQLDDPAIRAWSGYAFEQICLAHTAQIKIALGIKNVKTSVSTWQGTDGTNKAQVDMVIDRRDEAVNICEVKFATARYTIDKAYAEQLRQKMAIFRSATATTKSLFLTMITTHGLTDNAYASDPVHWSLTMDDLFG